ncbi:MAG TPA: hypothetical protein VE326_08420 [Candidatus Binatia bacterium]|nr:hypothetical protein [Candidatus Binatia bacterium]
MRGTAAAIAAATLIAAGPASLPARAAAAPAIRQAPAGPPEVLRTERIFDRATLESWGVPRPTRLAFDGDGALYILDAGRRRLVKVGEDGALIHDVALSGDDPASTTEPADVVVDARGSALVLDRASASVLAYDKNGALLAARPLASDLADEARDPRAALVQDSFGRLWLLAPRERDLIRLDASLARERAGRFLTPDDSVGTPGAVAATPNGDLWMADAASGALRRFRASGALAGGAAGDSAGTGRYAALAVDGSGYVYAADASRQRIVVFDQDGSRVMERVLGGGEHAWRPSAITWGGRDRLAAADAARGEVQIFALERGAGRPSGARAP